MGFSLSSGLLGMLHNDLFCIFMDIRGRVVKTSVSYHKVSHQQAASVRILLELI
jgi:hypothetical protein